MACRRFKAFASESKEVLEDLIAILDERFGKITPLMVSRGDIHKYLGMTLDYSVPAGEVTVRMDDYVSNLFEEVPEDTAGTATTHLRPSI